MEGSVLPEKRDSRLDYENVNIILKNTQYDGIWIIKPFHTMKSTIKHNLPITLNVVEKESKKVVLFVKNCVACWK